MGSLRPALVPPGLEYLTTVDHLFIKQEIELAEILLQVETQNRYRVFNAQGFQVFHAEEDTDFWSRNLLGPHRPFDIRIMDANNVEVLHVYRPFNCCFGCCGCSFCLQVLEVSSPLMRGEILGYVKEKWSMCGPKYNIENKNEEPVLRIVGPVCNCRCFSDIDFLIYTLDRQQVVGRITRKWPGLLQEYFTDADNFGVHFPLNLEVKTKATILGAAFLIDFMFFENDVNEERRARRERANRY